MYSHKGIYRKTGGFTVASGRAKIHLFLKDANRSVEGCL